MSRHLTQCDHVIKYISSTSEILSGSKLWNFQHFFSIVTKRNTHTESDVHNFCFVSFISVWINSLKSPNFNESGDIIYTLFGHVQWSLSLLVQDMVQGWQSIGHKTVRYSDRCATMTAVARTGGNLTANSDWRRFGSVAGY